jgi:shikimate dehydrogenase
MRLRKDIAAIQRCITNPLDRNVIENQKIAGIVGDAPSLYSKSPNLWNAAFDRLGINAIYLPLDVDESRLADLIATLKGLDTVLGINVTTPHKISIMQFLDDVDAGAKRIEAVNTIVRTASGKLVGYNTDGQGFIESLVTPLPGQTQPFMPSLGQTDVLLLGAGGSARAVAFHVSDILEEGQLLIANRTMEHALSLSLELQRNGHRARAIEEVEVGVWARKAGLIINSTTKGQGGFRKLPDGSFISLESYSSLASACPPSITQSDYENAQSRQNWLRSAQADVDANNQTSISLAQSIPQNVRFYDLIYHPAETVFLRHARQTGHQTQNGKAMILCQAVIAFCRHICRPHLIDSGKSEGDTYRAVFEVMAANW